MFEREQGILDDALAHIKEVRSGTPLSVEKFEAIVKEYKIILKQHRKVIKISDRASTSMIIDQKGQITDLLGKVRCDALTGIYNRRFLEENLKRIIKSISRSGGELSVLMLDIDCFKKYNDTYGHSEGDACLKTVAETIAGCLSRANDFVARYGGEEFCVVLPDTGEAGAQLIAAKIIENILAKSIPHEKSDVACHLTVSIGGTTSEVLHTQSGDDYIKQADKALYQSKKNGRNRYTCINFKEGK